MTENGAASATFHLRQALPTDTAAIHRLTREAYAKWIPVIGREPRPMSVDYEAAMREHRFDLLYLGAALVGLIETAQEEDRILIVNVAVAPDFQGRGLGRKLMAQAEEIAASCGVGRIRLYTNKRFEANIRLYGRLGYRVDREEDVGDGIAIHMSKDIAITAA